MFAGIILIVIGVGIVMYSSVLTDTFGRRGWAERYLGGTTQGFVKIGFAIMILGVLVTFGGSGIISTKVPQGFTTTNPVVK